MMARLCSSPYQLGPKTFWFSYNNSRQMNLLFLAISKAAFSGESSDLAENSEEMRRDSVLSSTLSASLFSFDAFKTKGCVNCNETTVEGYRNNINGDPSSSRAIDMFKTAMAQPMRSRSGENLVVAVDDDGLFTERITHFSAGRLVKPGSFVHSYPFCCRSDTPLIYRTVPSWFVQVELLKEQLLENNTQTHWIPDYVKVTEERSMIYIYYKYSSFRE
ncbi:hypothetical protein F2Q68_00008933 [Brassica cretica]|uniref:Aminoacyl-tRNA synthetase class Ia domain-containing protein n=1 Tax=Brassica cretica TaxID=69181 RepID=A0A8S9KQW3_BRACR|nr:hypothetical protein F2Q68_00008933 [Brassica cretica]